MVVKLSNFSFGSIILLRFWVSRNPPNQNVLLAQPCCASNDKQPFIWKSILLKNESSHFILDNTLVR